jgi:preprotein translocase subunit SecE
MRSPQAFVGARTYMANTTTASDGDVPRKQSTLPTPNIRRKGPKRFFAEVGREMRKVDWPTKHETNRLTTVVLGVCGIVVVVLSTLGYVFDMLVQLLTTGKVG